MRTRPLWKHLVTVLTILGSSYLLFTLFPSLFPHPEDFSPYTYVVAFVALVESWLMLKDGKRRWLLLPILFLCLLALLDETGYGSEVMDIKPFYSQTLHTEIRDLHNAIGLAIELGARALEDWHWNASLFVNFLTLDGILLAAWLLFGSLLRFRTPRSEEKLRNRILWLVAGFWLASGLTAAVYLLRLPQDPKNAFFLGHSAIRLISAVGTFVISAAPIAFLMYQRKTPQGFPKSISNWLSEHSRVMLVVSIMLALVSFAYQFYAPLVFLPDQQTRLERITPIVLWLLAFAWFALLGLMAWRGHLRRPITELGTRLAEFLRREPGYFYTIGALTLILIAQLIDRDLIPLNTLIQTPNFYVKLWGLWTEETFEMTGAFLFITAAFYFPKTK